MVSLLKGLPTCSRPSLHADPGVGLKGIRVQVTPQLPSMSYLSIRCYLGTKTPPTTLYVLPEYPLFFRDEDPPTALYVLPEYPLLFRDEDPPTTLYVCLNTH